MKKLYFITGSQDLYGEEVLARADADGREIAAYLSQAVGRAAVEAQPVVRNADEVFAVCAKATADPDCIGVIMWMHTFSPAKMWIRGLQVLHKPLLHLHTQFNEALPYDGIDMDFMNLNQSAHGDREFGFICARLGVAREIVAGYYRDGRVVSSVRKFADVALGIDASRGLRVAMIGGNMRDVAVTDGDRVESEIRYGWSVNYYGIGDIADIMKSVSDKEISDKMKEYAGRYEMCTDDLAAVRDQARCEVALRRFVAAGRIGAFTDTFQDLHGLRSLPGLAVQNMMADGIGFAAEGDYKTAALMAVLCRMAEGMQGGTAFLEDYTYDFAGGRDLELAAHMLEVSPVFAAGRPKVEVHPLGIGGKEPPARLVFDGAPGRGIAVSMVDMGDRFRLVCADIEIVPPPEDMPKLPVAQLMWRPLPDLRTSAAAWIRAGGAHHSVVSTALDASFIRLFAKLTDTELIEINSRTEMPFGA